MIRILYILVLVVDMGLNIREALENWWEIWLKVEKFSLVCLKLKDFKNFRRILGGKLKLNMNQILI
jgi:hypothetical protein